MRSQSHTATTPAHAALAVMAGWSPQHRSLEAEAAELSDISERDTAARATFARRAAK